MYSMRNIKLIIEYDGTNYYGWQRQRNTRKTLQETIEKRLEQVLQEKVRLVASGRTDSGVHAIGQVVNFRTNSDMPLKNLKMALNSLLPDDIAVIRAEEVGSGFHARFKARSKTYRYTILNRDYPSVLQRNFVYFFPYKLDVKLMQRAARLLIGRHDFSCFQGSSKRSRRSGGPSSYSKKKACIRVVERISISKRGSLIYIDIQANGFLYKMVRNIVGTLIEIGRKRYTIADFKRVLVSRNRQFAGPTVPSRGLCLLKVAY